MRKEDRDTIIVGIGGALAGGTISYLAQGKYPWDPWAYISTYTIFFALAYLLGVILRKRRELKKSMLDTKSPV